MPKSITPEQLKERMDSEEGAVVLDVRAADAYADWKIEGEKVQSINIQNSKLRHYGVEAFSAIPKDREVVTVCAKGISAQEAAELLENKGYKAVFLSGGMTAWSEFYELLPVVTSSSFAIYQVMRLAKGCLSYIVTDGKDAAVFDAGRHTDKYLDFARQLNLHIKSVFDTHLHADHISGGPRLAQQAGANYFIAAEEAKDANFSFNPVPNDKTFSLGQDNVRIKSIRTPGHTAASTCFLINEKYILSGDTLFVSGLGRSDLKGRAREMAEEMFATLRRTIANWSDQLMILPGHYSDFREINSSGYVGEPLSEIRSKNPMLHLTDKDVFVQIAVGNTGVTPPNHETIISINRDHKQVSADEESELEIGPNRCAVKH
ncbi:MBL fold metallo-hydrolase [Alicyclobacillus sp. SO9]|uniref:MBL fold metallo-hydrolase n=1 Tax=Alicyclobacillus sp. SO9 TaxID=2665646 RepID=UPI0018E745CE|nr:MBL fold metallo-hydrolase [Alicyclobacillus sp. SO9]QQE80270.1 MBL fold metallo-hydrolase [Alicyclobacillus sp. SO9]